MYVEYSFMPTCSNSSCSMVQCDSSSTAARSECDLGTSGEVLGGSGEAGCLTFSSSADFFNL